MVMRLLRTKLTGVLGTVLIGGSLLSPVARAEDPDAGEVVLQDAGGSQELVEPIMQRANRVRVQSTSLQPPTPPGDGPTTPPTLPETEVVAEQQPAPPQPQPQQPPYDPNSQYPTVLRGTIFASPSVTGYNADSATVGSFINVPTRILPATVNTITRDVIRDQQILNMDETLRNIPAAVKSFGNDGVIRPDQFFIRGFEANSQTFRKDGYLDPTYVPRDVANIERIDVLKGPNSVMYGASQPTGTFNVITKKPMLDPYLWGGATFGSFDLQRYAFDANSAVTVDKTVLIRINGAYQHNNSFRDTVFQEREFIAPVVSWAMSDDASLTWAVEYQHDRFRMDQGVPAINGNPFYIGRNIYTGNPYGDTANYHSYRSTLQFEKILNENWTLRIGEMSLWYDVPSTTTFLDNGSVGANGLLNSTVFGRDQTIASPFREQSHDVLETLGGDFDGNWFHHRAVIGAEQTWFITNHDTFTQTGSIDLTTFGTGSAFAPINVAGGGPFPVGSPVFNFPFQVPTTNVFDNPGFRQNRFGFFAQDIIDITPQLHLLMGGRFDYMTQTYARSNTFSIAGVPLPSASIPEIHTEDQFSRFSPRIGLTYDIIPDTMSVYGMYSKSFTPSVGVANFAPNVRLLPMVGDIWEGGFKVQATNRILWQTAGWWTRQQNVTVEQFDPNAPPGALAFFTTQAGIQRSQGVETSVTGLITDRLSTISNFAYTDAYLYGVAQSSIGTAPPIAQTRVRGIPLWTGNTWLRYNLIQDQDQTLGAAFGMRYVGNRLGDYASPFRLPSFNVWDIGCFYNRGWLGAQLLWDNIFDVNYAVSSISQYQVMPGAPSNIRLQFTAVY